MKNSGKYIDGFMEINGACIYYEVSGEGQLRPFYAPGDVNGSCSFNGLDITYMVNYFKGGDLPVPCPSCPPMGQLAPPNPGFNDSPAIRSVVAPNMNIKPKVSRVE